MDPMLALLAALGALWLGYLHGLAEGQADRGSPIVIDRVPLSFETPPAPYQ